MKQILLNIALLIVLFMVTACASATTTEPTTTPKPTPIPKPTLSPTEKAQAHATSISASATTRAKAGIPTSATEKRKAIIGGWDTDDDRALILAENGNFVAYFDDGTSMSGTWKLSGSKLCLTADVGAASCMTYSQNGNKMTLGDATYYRR